MRREKITIYEKRILSHLVRFRKDYVFIEKHAMSAVCSVTDEQVKFADKDSLEYKEIKTDDNWGKQWQSAWFHVEGEVPSEWQGGKVVTHFNFGGEACIFDKDGCPIYGLTNCSVFDHQFGREIYPLFEKCGGGEKIDLWIEAAANRITGIDRHPDSTKDSPVRYGSYASRVEKLEICLFDENMWQYFLEIELLNNLMLGLPENSPRRMKILKGINKSFDLFQDKRENLPQCREALAELLASPANASDCKICAVGHAHIDTGWLWPVKETVRKCCRTFANQVSLLERFPEYVFGASQPQHYQFVKDNYPALYEKVKELVKEGRWELQGGMWVEADCNLISGESMVRQILHGKNFFKDEFGVDVRNVWIPDVFGYSAAMPQIMKRAGVDYFLTQKISWSQFNEFPHNTFNWIGLDGSSVITHFPPENSYNSTMYPQGQLKAQNNFSESAYLDEFMCLFGIGDGGGGPREDHIENAMRMKNIEGTPKVKMGKAEDFFERLSEREDELEEWEGELYLEYHRGTLTTQARTKKNNRNLEKRLRDVEFIYSCADFKDYPAEELDRIWKMLLLNQFHDIIPGSSIRMVYETTEAEHEAGLAECDNLIAEAGKLLLESDENCLTLFNTLTSAYTAPVELPEGWAGAALEDKEGNEILTQQNGSGAVVAVVEIPPQSFKSVRKTEERNVAAAEFDKTELVLENDLVRYEFSENGEITSAFDKDAEREILVSEEQGNVLALYEDRPITYDAWDIDVFYEDQLLENAEGVTAEKICAGPVRCGLKFELKIGVSKIEQEIYLYAGSKRLEFKTAVDWKEQHRMLRAAFPTTINSASASFDIQYGYVTRETHNNDSWDMAKFEVAAHRYADLSASDYGCALLNDCKYGYKVKKNILDLNLLRSSTDPDPDADQGHHEFTYVLLPH
ncbi:MAG: alpha-mannosidase, partial [Planctomycetota bacterium]